MPNGYYAAVIEKLRPGAAEPGEIVHLDGRVLGRHEGVIHYTVGQRRGLGIGGGEPLYVVRLEPAARRVVVGPRAALATRTVPVAEVNWLGDAAFEEAPAGGWEVAVRVRSTRPPRPARVHPRGPDARRGRAAGARGGGGARPGLRLLRARGQPGARRRLDRSRLRRGADQSASEAKRSATAMRSPGGSSSNQPSRRTRVAMSPASPRR